MSENDYHHSERDAYCTDQPSVSFGKCLREMRIKKGLSIRKLAQMAGVSNAYLSQVETGTRGVPSPRILKRLALPLGVAPSKLLEIAWRVSAPQSSRPQVTIEISELLKQNNLTFKHIPLSSEDLDELTRYLERRLSSRNK